MNKIHKFFKAFLLFLLSVSTLPVLGQPVNPVKRYALLVGVKDYQPLGYDNRDRHRLMLRNLHTPCEDIERIATQLEMVGWKREESPESNEIEVICDANDDQIAGRIKDLIEGFDDENGFLFVYLSGHGVQINNRSYIFAKHAVLDMPRAAKRLKNNPSNVVFQGQSIELSQDLFMRANEFYGGNILLVLDSCRDDPLYLETMHTELQVPITSPQIAQQSDGIMVLYATTPGKRVSDGIGLSYLADAFVRNIQLGMTVDKVVSEVKKDVRIKTRHTHVPQAPERLGSLNNADICFAGCVERAASTIPPRRSNALFASRPPLKAALYRYFASPHSGVDGVGSSRLPHKYRNLFQSAARKNEKIEMRPSAINVDIFWCEDGDIGRELKASQLGELISKMKGEVISGSKLERVRIRALSAEENLRPAYRVDENVIRIDKNSIRQSEWAKAIASASTIPLKVDAEGTTGLDSIDVVLCSGARTAERAPRIWIHVPSIEHNGVALVLRDEINRHVSEVKVETYIDIKPISPEVTQVRYFHKQDEAVALDIAKAIGLRLRVKPTVVYMPKYANITSPKRLELWVGRGSNSAVLIPGVD